MFRECLSVALRAAPFESQRAELAKAFSSLLTVKLFFPLDARFEEVVVIKCIAMDFTLSASFFLVTGLLFVFITRRSTAESQ